MRTILYCLCLYMLSCSACATIINGPTQEVPVTSDPSGATAIHPTEGSRETPCKFKLQRDEDHTITVQKEGYKTEIVELRHVMSGAVAGNIIAGGLIGWGIDAATGADCRLVPETVIVKLDPVEDYVAGRPKSLIEELRDIEAMRKESLITEEEYKTLRSQCMEKHDLPMQAMKEEEDVIEPAPEKVNITEEFSETKKEEGDWTSFRGR